LKPKISQLDEMLPTLMDESLHNWSAKLQTAIYRQPKNTASDLFSWCLNRKIFQDACACFTCNNIHLIACPKRNTLEVVS